MAPIDPDSQLESPPSHVRQLALQCAAAFAVLSLMWPYFVLRNEALPWGTTTLAIGAVAFLTARLTRQAWWWQLIHAAFAPLAWLVVELSIDPGWFLLAFVLMLLVYRGAVGGQVPLYLSNEATARALGKILKKESCKHFLDLGAGIGSVLSPLAIAMPEAQLTGIENAPATWFIGWLRTVGLSNCRWRLANIWHSELGEYDVVYAFLSPAPMAELWGKIRREMRSGSLFISNSFVVPGIEVTEVVEVNDARQTRLYCYRL